MEIAFEAERDVEGYVVVEAVGNPNGGLFKLEMDGVVWAEEINCHAPRYGRGAMNVDVGRKKLSAGRHVMRLESLGPASGSEGSRILLRGFKVLDRPASTDYVLGLSNKLPIRGGDLGRVIGSRETGAVLSAIWSGPVSEGQELRFFSLAAPKSPSADLQAGNCLAIAPNAAALELPDGYSIAAVGQYGGVNAEIGVIESGHLAAYAATRCGEFAASDSPVDMDWSFASGVLSLHCTRRTTLTLALADARVRVDDREPAALTPTGDGYTLVLEAGRHAITGAAPRAALMEENRKWLAAAFREAAAARLQAPVVEEKIVMAPGAALRPTWQAQLGEFPRGLHVFRSGGQSRVAIPAGRTVHVFDAAGAIVCKLEADDLVEASTTGPKPTCWPRAAVISASSLSTSPRAAGVGSFESTEINPVFKKSGYTGWFDRNPAHNKGIHALNSGVFLDGRSQLLVGTACTVEALDENGRLLQKHLRGYGRGHGHGVARLRRRRDPAVPGSAVRRCSDRAHQQPHARSDHATGGRPVHPSAGSGNLRQEH